MENIITGLTAFTKDSPLNFVAELNDLRIFDSPLVGVANADDPLFARLKRQDGVGPFHLSPQEWLAECKSVISYFLPFSEAVRAANRNPGLPSLEWLYGRIEGQNFNNALSQFLVANLNQAGYHALAPALDPRFAIVNRRANWSERHVAYIAGLGTLSLNCSLITKVGSAGRIGSIVVALELEATERCYEDFEENCCKCGACIRRCPPGAISENGKDHAICAEYLEEMKSRFHPRYGCGKCQTAVPCENKSPVAK